MAGLDASFIQMSLSEYEAASSFVNLEVTSMSPLTSITPLAVSSLSTNGEGGVFDCKNGCPHLEDSGVSGLVQDDVMYGASLGTEDGTYHNTEKGKSLSESRATQKGQVCAICHDKIKAEETAEIKGCEHTYCVTCILRWASYKTEPWCPQCRLPFSFLYVYRALDGSLADFLIEESVCLLLRAFWFTPLVVEELEEQDDYHDDYDGYEESYYTSNVRLGNRRWGDSGYVRAGRLEARPIGVRQVSEPGSSMGVPHGQVKGKEPAKQVLGRRARRAQKREQLDKNAK